MEVLLILLAVLLIISYTTTQVLQANKYKRIAKERGFTQSPMGVKTYIEYEKEAQKNDDKVLFWVSGMFTSEICSGTGILLATRRGLVLFKSGILGTKTTTLPWQKLRIQSENTGILMNTMLLNFSGHNTCDLELKTTDKKLYKEFSQHCSDLIDCAFDETSAPESYIQPNSSARKLSPKSTLPCDRKEVSFLYEDSNGNQTRRTIDAKKIEIYDSGTVHIIGFCHLRKSLRTFNADGIESDISDNGKRYDVYDWLKHNLGVDLPE